MYHAGYSSHATPENAQNSKDAYVVVSLQLIKSNVCNARACANAVAINASRLITQTTLEKDESFLRFNDRRLARNCSSGIRFASNTCSQSAWS